jgi:hypothetical protein
MAKRTIDELSGSEKRRVAEDLIPLASFFGVVPMAAVLFARLSAGSLVLPLRTRAERRST